MEENIIAKLSSTPPPRKWKYTAKEATARLNDLETLCGVPTTATPIGNISFLHSRIALLEPVADKMSKLTTAKVFADAGVTLSNASSEVRTTPTPAPPKTATTVPAVSATLTRKEFDALPKDWQAEHVKFGGIVTDPQPQAAAAVKPLEKVKMSRAAFQKMGARDQANFAKAGIITN